MTLMEIKQLMEGKFAARVKMAALAAALTVPWVADDWASSEPAEKASRQVLAGGEDFTNIIMRAAFKAQEMDVPMQGDDDVAASDADLITIVGSLLVDSYGH